MICQTEIGQLGHMVPWCITEGPHRELASLWSTHWQPHWTYWTYWTGKISKQTFSLRSKNSSEPILVCLTEWDWLCNITLALCNQAVPCVSCKGDKGHLRPRLVIELSGPTDHTSPLLYTSITNLVSCKSPPQCRFWLLIAKLQLPGRCQKIFIEMIWQFY